MLQTPVYLGPYSFTCNSVEYNKKRFTIVRVSNSAHGDRFGQVHGTRTSIIQASVSKAKIFLLRHTCGVVWTGQAEGCKAGFLGFLISHSVWISIWAILVAWPIQNPYWMTERMAIDQPHLAGCVVVAELAVKLSGDMSVWPFCWFMQ